MIFKEVENTPKNEDEPRKGEPKKLEFELDNRESHSIKDDGSNELDDEEEDP